MTLISDRGALETRPYRAGSDAADICITVAVMQYPG
jgi:hypothetical protein